MNKETRNRNLLFAVFFLSASQFGLLMLLSPVISTMLIGVDLSTVMLSPWVGFAIAATTWIYFPVVKKKQFVKLLPFIVFISMTIVFLILRYLQKESDLDLFDQFKDLNARTIESWAIPHLESLKLKIFILISIPFHFYAWFLFSALSSESTLRVYGVELIGALVGTIFSVFVLERFGFQFVFSFILLLAGISQFALISKRRFNFGFTVFFSLVILFVFSNSHWFEPQRNVHLISRDFQRRNPTLTIEREDWTSYAKIQTVKMITKGEERKIIVLGDGTGIAEYPLKVTKSRNLFLPQIVKALLPLPKSVAVLFAGAGVELVELNRFYQNQTSLVGVELNPKLVEMAKSELTDQKQGIPMSSVHLIQSDARQFLESNRDLYDALLFSWSGATVAHFSGAIAHTTQYSFTLEAIKSAVQKINKNGFLIVAGASKVNLILLLKQLEKSGSIHDLEKSVLILGNPAEVNPSLKKTWDDLILIWKNGTVNETDIDRIRHELKSPIEIVHSPFAKKNEFLHFLLTAELNDGLLTKIRSETGVNFDIHTDANPFVYESYFPVSPFKKEFWPFLNGDGMSLKMLIEPRGFLLICILVVILLFLMSFRKGSLMQSSWNKILFGLLVGWIGASLQLLTLFRLLLLVSNPTQALLLGVGGGLVGALIGIRLSRRFNFITIAILAAISVGLFMFAFQNLRFGPFLFAFLVTNILWCGLFPKTLFVLEKNENKEMAIWCFDAWGAVLATLIVPIYLRFESLRAVQALTAALCLLCVVIAALSIVVENKRTSNLH